MRMKLFLVLVCCLFGAGVRYACAAEQITPAGPWQNPPELPGPKGKVVHVKTEGELQRAVRSLKSGTTILIKPGTYKLTNTLHIHGGLEDIALRGDSEDRNAVVLLGKGMRTKNYGNVPHGIMVSNAQKVLIANLSVGDVWYHPITLQGPAGCQAVRIYNCRLFEAGEQFLKVNPANKAGSAGVNDGIVEYCVFEYKDTARHWYTEGVDVHSGRNWVIRNNLFRNIRGPKGAKNVGGAIDFWNHAADTLVEGNVIWNCAVGIRLGFRKRGDGRTDHSGGIVRNNVVVRQKGACHWQDVGILVGDSPGTKVLFNTVFLDGTYANAIECRFPASKGLLVAGNLTDGAIRMRDGAEATIRSNATRVNADAFQGIAGGDWHLSSKAKKYLNAALKEKDCPVDIDGEARGRKADLGADEKK